MQADSLPSEPPGKPSLHTYIHIIVLHSACIFFFFSSFVFSLVPLLQLCDFLSPKIYDFISIIYPWRSKYNTAKENKSLDKLSFSKNWAKKIKRSGKDQKADKFSSIVYFCTMTESICSSMNLKGKTKPEDCRASGNGSDSSLHYLCVTDYTTRATRSFGHRNSSVFLRAFRGTVRGWEE